MPLFLPGPHSRRRSGKSRSWPRFSGRGRAGRWLFLALMLLLSIGGFPGRTTTLAADTADIADTADTAAEQPAEVFDALPEKTDSVLLVSLERLAGLAALAGTAASDDPALRDLRGALTKLKDRELEVTVRRLAAAAWRDDRGRDLAVLLLESDLTPRRLEYILKYRLLEDARPGEPPAAPAAITREALGPDAPAAYRLARPGGQRSGRTAAAEEETLLLTFPRPGVVMLGTAAAVRAALARPFADAAAMRREFALLPDGPALALTLLRPGRLTPELGTKAVRLSGALVAPATAAAPLRASVLIRMESEQERDRIAGALQGFLDGVYRSARSEHGAVPQELEQAFTVTREADRRTVRLTVVLPPAAAQEFLRLFLASFDRNALPF